MTRSSFTPGTWRWLLQRVTAVFLLGALAFHMVSIHGLNHASESSFMQSQQRMSQVGYFAFIWVFLLTATVHGVTGVCTTLVNLGLPAEPARSWPRC
ncbi:MAG: succinate dehydrogenase, hydrophobic anchor subunit [halophilic archaeon J07HX5]|jgi:succinate dehydrogenase subunit D (EC 1.3.5.1)|nr:MAG: succinate dehydrogenase, hydrophobic anchor subunit [halophilic archaeon J07HX5]